MNLAGTVVPVVRLSRLLSLPDREVGPYDHVIVLRHNYALLVDCVTGLIYLDQVELMPVPPEVTFNECVTNCFKTSGSVISLLSESQLMLREERLRLKEVQDRHQSRLAAVGEGD